MPRCVPTLALAAGLVLAGGCASAEQTAAPPGSPATVAGSEPLPEPGSFVPTSAGSIAPAQLPPGLQAVDAMAGHDPTEASCIRQGIAASVAPGEDRPEVGAGVAGTAVVACLPPAKLAATLADRLADPALGLGLTASQLACVRATLAGDGASPAYTELIGGVALGDATAVRQGAAGLDAACGTRLASPAPA
jgi:hypothetical protein